MLALALAVLAALSAPPAPADTVAVVPRRMSLDLVLDPARAGWSGSTRGWLTVRRPVRGLVLRFAGPVLSAVEMNQREGAVPLVHATRQDSLCILTDRGLVPGPAGLSVAYLAAFADSGRGLVRRGYGTVVLDRGAGTAFPVLPGPAPLPVWRLDVHVPAGCTVRANLPRTGTSRQSGWRTFSFASGRPLHPDSLRLEVRRPPAARRATRAAGRR